MIREVDGYVAYLLGIPSDVRPIAFSGRPTLLIDDDLYGGTGLFLGTYAEARRRASHRGRFVAGTSRTSSSLPAGIAPADIQFMDKVLVSSRWQRLLISWLLGVFGTLALILASVGIYGVVVYTVSRRTHEIGIWIALGADTRQVRGLLASYVVGGLLRPLLYALSPSDLAITLGEMTLVLLCVASAASYVPARRASRMDPITALRWE